ncbi:ComF family protein, partial [Patescibacteria group bacterium]|nr:ComF family protein [Patescibacteria group bacterium]
RNIFALYDYHAPEGKRLVYTIKKKRDRILTEHIAKEMAHLLTEYISEQQQFSFFLTPIIVPVPITKRQKQKRGFNQTEHIAQCLARELGATYDPHLVLKTTETKKQALITQKSERFLNVKNCFSINKKRNIKHQDIIIVDDLVTTGATIQSLEKTLKRSGARHIIAITVGH